MADDPLASRVSAANVSRRTLLAGATFLPFLPDVATAQSPVAWERAVSAYAVARSRCEAFTAATLQPAYDHFHGGAGETPGRAAADERGHPYGIARILELEKRGDELLSHKLDALRELVVVPAPDRQALLLKARLSYKEIFRHDDDGGLIQAIFADVVRLFAGPPAAS